MGGRRLLIILGGLAVVLLLFLISFSVRAVPQPIIEIRGESLYTIELQKGSGTLWEVLWTFPIRNTLVTSWFVIACLAIIAWFSGRNLKLIPSGWQNFIETMIEGLYNLVIGTAGEKNGRRFFWVIATFFIYVAISNWFALLPFFNVVGKVEKVSPHHFHEEAVVVRESGISLVPFNAKLIEIHVDETACEGAAGEEHDTCIEHAREEAITQTEEEEGLKDNEHLAIIAPYFRSMNTDLMTPASLAVASAIFVEFWGISTLGFRSYGSKFFNFGALRKGPMGALDFFVGILEFVAEVVRLLSFSFRLFGNMLAGEVLLLVMTFLLPFAFVATGIFYGLEIFVGAIQAFIFGMLTLVFATMAVAGHGDEHAEKEHH